MVSRDCSSLLQAHYRLDGHPHVNPIHEVLVGDKRVYLIFPRSHSDLHSYVRARKRLREHEARRLFRQMAETVAACHEQGIVLRDLKLRKFVFADPQRWVTYYYKYLSCLLSVWHSELFTMVVMSVPKCKMQRFRKNISLISNWSIDYFLNVFYYWRPLRDRSWENRWVNKKIGRETEMFFVF